jgi:CRISPR-associated protein Cas2
VIVLVLSACPPGLRGFLTRWLMEISAGVFVGNVSARVRELLWERVVEMTRTGRAIMVTPAQNEQRLSFRIHGHHWQPVDIEGITLMLRPGEPPTDSAPGLPTTGWSNAAARRRR